MMGIMCFEFPKYLKCQNKVVIDAFVIYSYQNIVTWSTSGYNFRNQTQ